MRIESIVMPVSIAVLIVCFFNRDRLPRPAPVPPALQEEPRQARASERPFGVRYADTDYRIEPEFDYELTGMVVSFRHHDGDSRMHRRAGDHLNMLDLCVVWGDNVAHPDLNELEFWNGIFTCNVSTRDREAWAAFDMYQLSNNHLISDRAEIRDAVRRVRIGDQIKVRGWLSSYTGPGGTRGTSTTRTDAGDGACETIYVQDFAIVERPKNLYRSGLWGSSASLLFALTLYFRRPYRPYARK